MRGAAVVIGGGITALEITEGLRVHCRRVHYLLRGDRYWGSVLDATESAIVMSRLTADGIQIHSRTGDCGDRRQTGACNWHRDDGRPPHPV